MLVPFRRSDVVVGNMARPVPAKPSFCRARRLYRRSRVLKTPRIFFYSHFAFFQSAVHNDHTQRRIEGGSILVTPMSQPPQSRPTATRGTAWQPRRGNTKQGIGTGFCHPEPLLRRILSIGTVKPLRSTLYVTSFRMTDSLSS